MVSIGELLGYKNIKIDGATPPAQDQQAEADRYEGAGGGLVGDADEERHQVRDGAGGESAPTSVD